MAPANDRITALPVAHAPGLPVRRVPSRGRRTKRTSGLWNELAEGPVRPGSFTTFDRLDVPAALLTERARAPPDSFWTTDLQFHGLECETGSRFCERHPLAALFIERQNGTDPAVLNARKDAET